MLHRVDLAAKSLERYAEVADGETLRELKDLGGALRGARVAHINSTAYGGGVSELLRSLVPLYGALGIDTDWLVIPGGPEFFEVTKGFHNALQGASLEVTERVGEIYLEQNRKIAALLDREYDFVVVHDPQPAPLCLLHGRNNAQWIWRCHIDTSRPNPEVLGFLKPYLEAYDCLVFTMQEFVPEDLSSLPVAIIPPAIDPLSPKNMKAPTDLLQRIIEWTGVQVERPFLTQVSRFDRWKDPVGVIEVFRRVRKEVPGTQLALLGQMALDDPEGWRMYDEIYTEAALEPDMHVLTNFTGIGNMEVNAFQSCSSVVLQKSIKEGFGLVVSETLWKGTPVVAGRAGGIPMQMPVGAGGYLADRVDEFVDRIVFLLRNPDERATLGALGRAHVRDHFLITRLLADELRLLASLI